jgi:hypothetical protein
MLPDSLDCPFFIAPSVFSKVFNVPSRIKVMVIGIYSVILTNLLRSFGISVILTNLLRPFDISAPRDFNSEDKKLRYKTFPIVESQSHRNTKGP